ncbi:MAG TPA: TIGR01777 family oxidoreductase [Thermoanaerobaculia bacterium]
MKIAAAGASGFLGEPLVERLLARGHDVVVLSRNPAKVKRGRGVQWDARGADGAWTEEVASADVVINLAGENVGAGRWTEARKRRMVASRVDGTRALVTAMQRNPAKRRTFIAASAVGYYGFSRGDELFDERGSRGSGFLAELVEQWEAAARPAESISRLAVLRFGVALACDGGALAKMMLPFRFGAGGPVGNGQQWLSWIHREDALRAIEWAIASDTVRGVYNITAPEPVRNRDFAHALGRAMRRPSFMPTPAFALKAAFGEMASEVLLGGQRAVPKRALAEGFAFEYPTLELAFQHLIRR